MRIGLYQLYLCRCSVVADYAVQWIARRPFEDVARELFRSCERIIPGHSLPCIPLLLQRLCLGAAGNRVEARKGYLLKLTMLPLILLVDVLLEWLQKSAFLCRNSWVR